MTLTVRRLGPEDAEAVVGCFQRVYGDSYANELFYDPAGLAEAMREGRVGCVGAVDSEGLVLGHMAMSVHPAASVVELGNTVVDPAARGGGLAWQVGAELSTWCRELGYQGFLHYPTTDHHIMQRQSVKAGFETGLMLGYIPAETHGKVANDRASTPKRQAATIVYEPYTAGAPFEGFVPAAYADLVPDLALPTGLPRRWQISDARSSGAGQCSVRRYVKRGLARLDVRSVGQSSLDAIDLLGRSQAPCRQIDFSLADPAVAEGVEAARRQGFLFCGWLPGFRAGDVLRLQKLDESTTDLEPVLENETARRILKVCLDDG